MHDVAVFGVGEPADATHLAAGRGELRLGERRLDAVLDLVGQLGAAGAKNLIPLSGAGLCDAETMTPKSASMSAIRKAAAGVGITPASSTSMPELASPAATAAEMNSPETRGSRARTATRPPAGGAPSRRRGDPGRAPSRGLREAERQVER